GDDPVPGQGLDQLDPMPEPLQHPGEEPRAQVPVTPGELVDGARIQPERLLRVGLGEGVAAEHPDREALFGRSTSLALELVPSLAGEALEHVFWRAVALVEEVVLDALAKRETEGLQRDGLGLGREEHVDAGESLLPRQLE